MKFHEKQIVFRYCPRDNMEMFIAMFTHVNEYRFVHARDLSVVRMQRC